MFVAYEIDEDGLTVTSTSANMGTVLLPYGCGHHPYLSPGDALVDDRTLELRAATRIVTDNPRQLPTGTEAVDASPFDFITPHRLGDLHIDDPFTDVDRDGDGRVRVRLTGPDERTVELWTDEKLPILELYTGDTLAPHRRRRGLGAEPMTCPQTHWPPEKMFCSSNRDSR